MAYLTYEEYTNISTSPVSESDFNKLLPSTSFTLDSVTNYFYHSVDLETDVEYRKMAFKRAIAVTIDYYSWLGSSNAFQSSSYQSVTIGRTTLNEGSGTNNNIKSPFGNVPLDVQYILGPTGLLYKGVATSCW